MLEQATDTQKVTSRCSYNANDRKYKSDVFWQATENRPHELQRRWNGWMDRSEVEREAEQGKEKNLVYNSG